MNTDDTTQVETPPPAPSAETASAACTATPDDTSSQPASVESRKNGKAKGKPRAGAFKPKASQSGAAERVTKTGAVTVENESVLSKVPLFYYAERGQWFFADGRNSFTKVSDSQAKSYLATHGFNKSVKDGDGNTRAEIAMLWLMQRQRVHYAGALAGYPAGVHESGGIRFLVTDSPAVVTPKPGNCATIRLLVESMFFEEDRRQIQCFYLWASESFAAYYNRLAQGETDTFRHCPALAMFGPRGCGKTALIDLVLTPLFGGRKADPMNYLREPKFNKDLFTASLLVLDDKGASPNLAERRQRGEGIKDLIWKPEQRMEGKGVDALNLRPFWRLVIAGNDDEGGLQVCPALTASLEDKLLILRATQAEGLPVTHEENDEWAARIRAELPAFAAQLLAWRPPPDLELDPRTRIARFWHPQIVSALRELQPEMRLLELIDTLALVEPGQSLWEGKASEFERAMRGKDGQSLLDRVFVSTTSAGRMLTELARIAPDRVKKTDREGVAHYRIFRAP